MKLTVKQRLNFPAIFAANKNTISEACIKREIITLISISDHEKKNIDLKVVNNIAIWNTLTADEKQYHFSPPQIAYMRESVFNLSRSPDHDVSDDLLPICEMIMTY